MNNSDIKALLPIKELEEERLVNAGDLHAFLGVEDRFNTWINRRIDRYCFEENEDYVELNAELRNIKRGRPAIEYGLTMIMAEHICMMERTQKGERERSWTHYKSSHLKGCQLRL